MLTTKRASIRKLRRNQLDRKLSQSWLNCLDIPEKGYIREIRLALGMTALQLAQRLGISQPGIVQLEKSEELGTITLNSLRKAAEAMDCTVVYGLIPNRPLEEIVRERAKIAATRIVDYVGQSMGLEAQGIEAEQRKLQIEEITHDLVQQLSREIWEKNE